MVIVAMSILKRIAFYQERRDEVPNQKLASELAKDGNTEGIDEIASNLWNANNSIASDCLKVIYEIGYSKPELIADYIDDFLKLLSSKRNRMVWGAMIALCTVAHLKSDILWANLDLILKTMEKGTLITEEWGIRGLAVLARQKKEYNEKLMPLLLEYLEKSRPIDVPRRAELLLESVSENEKGQLLDLIQRRSADLSPAQKKRVEKALRKWT